MRLFFLVLAVANLAFFVVHQGYLGKLLPDPREPARLTRQIKPELLRLSGETGLPQAPAGSAAMATAGPNARSTLACVEYGSFGEDDSKALLADFGARFSTAQITTRNAEEITSYMIYLPPYKTREEAVQATEMLKQSGITDYFIIDDSSPLRLGISLGISRNEEMAKAQVATLGRKGIKDALVRPRTSKRYWLQIRDSTPDLQSTLTSRLADLKTKYPAQELKACPAQD